MSDRDCQWFAHKVPTDKNVGYRYIISMDKNAHGWWIASVHNGGNADQNARLIAAAPALLTALEKAEEALTIMRNTHENRGDYYDGFATQILPEIRLALHAASVIPKGETA